MLNISRDSWGAIPFEKAAPFNENDLIVFLSSKTALLISNIKNFSGERISIGKIMTSENHRDVFFTEHELIQMRNIDPAEIYNDKLLAFSEEMYQKLERYFITNKMPRYIFFDEKEQDLLNIIFTSVPLSCDLKLMSCKNGEWREIKFENLSPAGYANLRDMLGGIKIVAELDLTSYLKMVGVRVLPKRDLDKVLSDRILNEYPSLNVDDFKSYSKAKKSLQKELHPDRGGSPDEFKKFIDAIKQLECTKWFKALKEVDGNGVGNKPK